MRRLLIILFTLFTVSASAQQTFDTIRLKVPIQRVSLDNYFTKSETGNILGDYLLKSQGVTSIANNNTKDSLVYYVNNVRYAIPVATNAYSKSETDSISSLKVDKVSGKQLSTEDYTTAEKTKLGTITSGAEVNVNADWNASTGDAQILNKPVIPNNNNQLTNGANYITASGAPVQSVAGKTGSVTLVKDDVGLSNVDNTPDISKPISTATQNALNLKANDNAVVHKAGTDTIPGLKTFSGGSIYVNNGTTGSGSTGTLYLGDSYITKSYGSAWVFPSSVSATGRLSATVLDHLAGNFVTWTNGNLTYRTPSEALSDMGGVSSAVVAATYEPKIATKNTAFNKNFGITAGTVADGKMVIDSLTALNGRKVDTSYRDNVGLVYPWQYDSVNNRMYLSQSWLDSLAAKNNTWSLDGSSITNSQGKYFGYSVADSLVFKVKNGYSGIINAANQNTGFGYLGFTDAGAQRSRGSFNTWLGAHAGSGINYSTGSTYIGQNSRGPDSAINVNVIGSDALATKNNQTVIGNVNTKETKLYGVVLAGATGTDTLAKKIDLVNYVSLKNISDTLKSRNYTNDSIAFVDGHLNQWDLYRTGGTIKTLTTLPYDTTMFNFIVDNRDGTSNTLKVRLKTYSASFSPVVYWGDGDSTVYTGANTYSAYHTYASSGYYIAKIRVPTISDLRELYINDTTKVIKIAGLYGINKLTSLGTFSCAYSSLTNTIVDAVNYGNTIATLYLDHNNLTGFNATLPSSVTSLYINSNKISSSAQLVLSPYLTTIKLGSEAPGGITWVSADVNTMLQYVDTKTFNAGAKTLDVRQFNSATPTGAGLTAITSLQSKGFTVQTD